MIITKKVSEHNELYLYMNGKLIYKKWMNTRQSIVLDIRAYDKYTYASYTDLDIQNSPNIITVKAKIRFKTADEGGRSISVKSGYRPDHVFEYEEDGKLHQAFIGEINFDKYEELELGKTYEVNVRFPFAQRIERFIDKGRKWWIHEGPLKIGEGEMLDIEIPQKKKITPKSS